MKNRIIVYAGQYYDAETRLHYNYHRYYDPSLGRYLRADPIGLAGGVNLYAYVQNNPVILIDPYGLLYDHWQHINIDNDRGTVSYKGEIYAFRGSKGNWHQADTHPNAKTWTESCDSEESVAMDIAYLIVQQQNKKDTDFVLSGISTGLSIGGLLTGGTISGAFWVAGAIVDTSSFLRSEDPTQLGPSAVGNPLTGPVGKVGGTSWSLINLWRAKR